jgi:Flp pilus assembly pilin Flp
MAVNINVTEDENSIDINDVNVFTVHVKDLSVPGSIQVSQETADISEDTVDSSTEIRTIDLPADSPVAVSVNEIDATTVTVNTSETNVIEVSDNVSIVQAATTAATRKLRSVTAVDSIWDQSGVDAHYTDGNVGIGTRIPNHPLDVNGNVNATSFTGTFVGAISSSAQIAADISGALGDISTTVTANQSNISDNQDAINIIQSDINIDRSSIANNQNNISNNVSRLDALYAFSASISQSVDTNTSNIASNLTHISNLFAVSRSTQVRLTTIESELENTLISSSLQLTSEISGAFTATSKSLQSRISLVEAGSTSKTLISGSSQIAAEISGAFTEVSTSLELRVTLVEAGSTSKTLISGSSQIATEISGAFGRVSSSLQDRLTLVEAGSTSKTLISGSSQIAAEISGAFINVSESISSRTTTIENNLGQAVNTTSDVIFAGIEVTNAISASTIRSDSDAAIGGDLTVDGTVFGLQGFGITIDDVSITTDSTQFGSSNLNLHGFTGSVDITGSLTVTGSVSAHSFNGIFSGAVSSSAQIAMDISGAFANTSSSLQSRISIIETELENTLISGSSQIATEISGAFIQPSSSISTRLTSIESELENTLISGSSQIATEISGAFGIVSSSLQTRLTVVETELSNTLISGSSQISTEISGAFVQPSSSISTRLTSIESELENTLISSSAQIATEISGAFKNIEFSNDQTHGVVVYDNTAKKFYYTASYGGSGTSDTGTTTSYATSSTAQAVNLTKLIINDYSDDVSVISTNGVLQLTFGSPRLPYFSAFNSIGFNSNRFNRETQDYELNIVYDLRGNSFVKGELSASTFNQSTQAYESSIGVTTFSNSGKIAINSSLASYQSGSHIFTAKLIATDAVSGNPVTATETLDLRLNKLTPSDPTINFNNINVNALLEDLEIEVGAVGNIDFQLIEGDSQGWNAAIPHNSSFDSTIIVGATGTIETGEIEEYWTSGQLNDPVLTYTGSVSESWDRVRSLRFKSDVNGALPTQEELEIVANWGGTIKTGFNTISEIESVTMNFTPTNQIEGEFIFIVYDDSRGLLSSIKNVSSTYEEISMFDHYDAGAYRVYRKRNASVFPLTYRVEF